MITLSKEVIKEELTKVAAYNNYRHPEQSYIHTQLLCEFIMNVFCKKNNMKEEFYDGYVQALKDWCLDDELYSYVINDNPAGFLKWVEQMLN